MDSAIHLVILAQPGRSRDSLVALLRTLRPAGLFPIDPARLPLFEGVGDAVGGVVLEHRPDVLPELYGAAPIVLVDLAGLGPAGAQLLAWARRQWPGARTLALVETLRLTEGAARGAECILHRSVAAGELLAAVKRLSMRPAASLREPLRSARANPLPGIPPR